MARGRGSLALKNDTRADEYSELPRTVDWHNPRVVQILDASSRCFSRKGFARTTVQEIAREAGMTKSMIHYYFESKQALIQELQAFVYERYFARVKRKLAEMGPSTRGRTSEALRLAYDIVKDKQFLLLQLELLAQSGHDPALLKRMGVLQERTREMITFGILEVLGDLDSKIPVTPKVLGTLIGSVLHGLRVQELVDDDSETTQSAYDVFVALLIIALKHYNAESNA